jgi:hypothetical protein
MEDYTKHRDKKRRDNFKSRNANGQLHISIQSSVSELSSI